MSNMSLIKNVCNLVTVEDLGNELAEIEKNLFNSNKSLLSKLIKGFGKLTELLEQRQCGVYPIVVTWFRAYQKMLYSIDPRNTSLLRSYEKTVPTAISYIIGCLQFDPKDDSLYHYNLLEIIDALLQNKQCTNFTSGTIACMWKPISSAGDFNTQTLALKVFAKLLKNLGADKQEDELKSVKWANLNLFKDKLNKVIEGTTQIYVYENACRELLNNFNMELTRNVMIFSLHCNSLVIGNKFEFYKPLLLEKFWIDINFRPRTLSFRGRHKSINNLYFDDVDVNLKWTNIQLKNCLLCFTIEKADSKLPANIFSKLKKRDKLEVHINENEEERLRNNKYMIKYTNKKEDSRSSTDREEDQENVDPTLAKTPPNTETHNYLLETPCTSRNAAKKAQQARHYFLRQSTPKRKFFTAFFSDEDDKVVQKPKKKKTANKKPRILKPRNERKSVCKVVPVVVDLTATPDLNVETNEMQTSNKQQSKNNIHNLQQISDKQYSTILKEVNNLNENLQMPYQYQCENDGNLRQSYKGYKDMLRPSETVDKAPKTLGGGRIEIIEDRILVTAPKEYTNSTKDITAKSNEKTLKTQKRKLFSQNIFDQLKDSDSSPPRCSKVAKKYSIEQFRNTVTEDNNNTDCDVLRFDPNVIMCSTPIPSPQNYTESKNSANAIININDEEDNSDHFLFDKTRSKQQITSNPLFGADNETFKEPSMNCCTDQLNSISKCCNGIEDNTGKATFEQTIKDANPKEAHKQQISDLKGCVIYRKRLGDSEDSESEDENLIKLNGAKEQITTSPFFGADNKILREPLIDCRRDQLNSSSNCYNGLEENTEKATVDPLIHFEESIKDANPFEAHKQNVSDLEGCVIYKKRLEDSDDSESEDENQKQLNFNREPQKSCKVVFESKDKLNVKPSGSRTNVLINKNNMNNEFFKVPMINSIIPKTKLQTKFHTILGAESIANKINIPKNNHTIINQATTTVQYRGNNDMLPIKLNGNILSESRVNSFNTNNSGECTTKIIAQKTFIVYNQYEKQSLVLNKENDAQQCITYLEQNFENSLNGSATNQCSLNNNTNNAQYNNKEINSSVNDNRTIKDQSVQKSTVQHRDNLEDANISNATYNDTHFNIDDSFKMDLSQLKEKYFMELTSILNNIRPQCLTNTFDDMKNKIYQLCANVIKQSKDYKREIDQLREAIQSLVRQIECHYEMYTHRCKQFDSFQHNAESILDEFGSIILQSEVHNEYHQVFEKLKTADLEISKQIWRKFFKENKEDLLKKINLLSEI